MGYGIILIFALIVLVSLFLTGMYIALQRRESDLEPHPQIHHSGVYSLVRQSPREMVKSVKPRREDLASAAASAQPPLPDKERKALLELWDRQIERNVGIVEEGDRAGIQTYSYEIPDGHDETRRVFGEGLYLTRDQISTHPYLIPPFYLGCRTVLVPRQPWNLDPGLEWRAMVPQENGKYAVPDWRIVVRS